MPIEKTQKKTKTPRAFAHAEFIPKKFEPIIGLYLKFSQYG